MIERARKPHRQRDRAFHFERQIGQHRAHHRLVVEMLLEHRAIAAMVHRLRQRHAHEAGRCEHAVEPGQLHHLDDGAHARALVADAQRICAGKFDLARRIGAVAELVLQPLQPQRVTEPSGPEARHEKAGQPARRLRQHQEGIAHRRGQKPFVSGDRIASPAGVAVVELARTSVPPCFSVMPMPSVMPGFSHHGRNVRVVAAAHHFRRDFGQQRGRGR